MISAGRVDRNRNWCRIVFGYVKLASAFALVGACFLVAVEPVSALAVSRYPASGNPVTASSPTRPTNIVIAVDESYSITKQDIVWERQAAQVLAVGDFSPESRIGVLGFGGDDRQYNAKTDRQSPWDQVCPMTEVNTQASRQSLSDCIDDLHKRLPGQGDYTDFIDAISHSVADLVSPPDSGRPLLLFLLTDGWLDMVDTPRYPGDIGKADSTGNQVLQNSTLPLAKADGVSIWPLAFGSKAAVDGPELQKIVTGGAQDSCDPALRDATPHVTRVDSAADVQALPQLFADATCGNYAPPTPKSTASIGPGGSADLYVTVPAVVTSGSIVVTRQSSKVKVTYFDPDGRQVPASGASFAGQTFSFAGTNGPVEALTVAYPIPGCWRVHVAAPAGVLPGGPVTASVLWQGVLHSDIVIDPPDPVPGQLVGVTVKLQVRTRPLSASDLAAAHVQVSVRVTGGGRSAPISVAVNDDGARPDQTARDGIYTGTFTVPRSARGALIARAAVLAQGVMGDTDSVSIAIDSDGLAVTGQMTLPESDVTQGGQVPGTVRLSNPGGKPHTIRLVTVDTPPGVTIAPSKISLPGTPRSTTYQFTLRFAASVPVGAVTGQVNASDARTGSVYAEAAITSTVVAALKSGYRWWYPVLYALSLIVAGLAGWGARVVYLRRRRAVRARAIPPLP
jgi:hypothetical protein